MIRYYLKNIEWNENIPENETEMEIVCRDDEELEDALEERELDILAYEIVKTSQINDNELKKSIYKKVDDKVNSIFYDFQTELGIKYGDIMPDQFCILDDLQDKLTNLIYDVLSFELGIW